MVHAPHVFEASELPEVVQRTLLAHPQLRDLLRANAFLSDGVWLELLSTHGSSERTAYLGKNLTRRRVTALLRALPALELGERRLADVDLDLTAWLLRHGVGVQNARLALASGLPNVANVAMRNSSLPLALRARLARNAYRSDRLLWMAGTEGDPLSDEEVWSLASAPDTLEGCCEGTMLDDLLRRGEVCHAAQLLHVRPGLVSRAIAAKDPLWLLAASAVKLSPEDQLSLLAGSEASWGGPDADRYLEALSAGGYQGRTALDPLGNLASAPWCLPEVWEHLRSRDRTPTRVFGRDLLRDDDLGYRRHRRLRNLDALPPVDLASAPPDVAERWMEHGHWTSALSGPYVLVDLVNNRHLGTRLARERRRLLRARTPHLSRVLPRLGRGFPEPGDDGYARYSSPEVSEARSVQEAPGAAPAAAALVHADAGFGVLLAAGLTDRQWETALTLLFDGFSGTVDELALTALRL